jgi:hypothetical protein
MLAILWLHRTSKVCNGGNLANALTFLSGEPATGAQQPAFQLMNQFLGIMLDPFVDGRAGVGGGAIPFAPERGAIQPPKHATIKAPAAIKPILRMRSSRLG